MADWKNRLRGNPIGWLLEPDKVQPAIRYFTLRDIMGRTESDSEVKEARAAIMRTGPVPAILAAQESSGYWAKPGPGYSPKYRSTVWQIIFLAKLGADKSDARVKAGCDYLLDHALSKYGWFSFNGAPAGFVHCLAGNLEPALIDLGYLGDERLQSALEKHARFVTGVGLAEEKTPNIAERYYSHASGPMFACRPNAGLPCAWGAIKALNAFSKVPQRMRTPIIVQAINRGVDFLLSHDPAVADYPYGFGNKPSSIWFKFGFPLGYTSDILENLEVLATLGRADDPRLARAIAFVENKQDSQGRWRLENSLNGKMWVDIEKKGQPSNWITLRALRVLKAAYSEPG